MVIVVDVLGQVVPELGHLLVFTAIERDSNRLIEVIKSLGFLHFDEVDF